jgi:alpha-glucosidase (family GH31 glycosyl hydrolase)
MWGRALLISPVLDEGARNVTAYFPAGRWFNYYNGSGYNSNGQYMVLDAPLTYIPLHVLGGNVIPQQRPNTTTISSRVNPYSLLVALDHSGLANGSLFTDDGEELNSITDGHYTLVTFDVKPNMLISNVVHAGYINNTALENIMIYGLSQPPASVSLNDSQITTWSWNDMVLDVYVDVVSITESFTLSWT